MVGPVPVGTNKFLLQAPAPNFSALEQDDILGVTVVLVTCSYLEHEFVRVGYFVNNEYSEPYDPENPPRPLEPSKVFRNILADEPRVTRFPIDWTGSNAQASYEMSEADMQLGEMQAASTAEDDENLDEEDDEDDDDEDDEEEEGNVEIDVEDEDADVEYEDEGEESSEMEMQIEDEDSMDVTKMQSTSSAFSFQ